MIRAYYFALSSGILSGSLHAITGPDHFTAVLPVILNNRWWKSGCYGGCWGFGHGICSALVGFVGFFMKEYLLRSLNVLVQFRFLSDLMIGLTLLTISVMGLLEATEEDEETEVDEETADVAIVRSPSSPRGLVEQLSGRNDNSNSSSSSSLSASSLSGKNESIKASFLRRGIVMSTLLLNGFIMGLSWDGLPSLAPTMLLNFEQVIVFLGSYLFSTAFIMAVVSGMIGESSSFLSSSLSQKSEGAETANEETSEHFANRFALLTSFTAGVIGFLWLLVGTGKGVHYLLSFLAMESVLLPAQQNDGLVVVNDGLAHQKHNHNVEEICSVDFTINMIISSLSIVLMVSSLIMGIFYPSSRLEERIRAIAVKCHSRYNLLRDCFQRRIPEALSPVPMKSLKIKSKD
jgi:hypothetical protein